MTWLRRKRYQVMMPRHRRARGAEPWNRPRRFNFRFAVDVTALIASIATVTTLVYLIYDRRDSTNIAAWTLLQGYLNQEHRPEFDEGQRFALETLVQHGIKLDCSTRMTLTLPTPTREVKCVAAQW